MFTKLKDFILLIAIYFRTLVQCVLLAFQLKAAFIRQQANFVDHYAKAYLEQYPRSNVGLHPVEVGFLLGVTSYKIITL